MQIINDVLTVSQKTNKETGKWTVLYLTRENAKWLSDWLQKILTDNDTGVVVGGVNLRIELTN